VFKHHPLDFHQDAPLAHQASAAAHNQQKFWEYHDKLFLDTKKLKRDDLIAYAKELDLDMEQFQKDLDDLELKKKVDADKKEAVQLGATGTPAFFVNGRFLSGAKPFDAFAEVINEELKKKGIAIPPAAAEG